MLPQTTTYRRQSRKKRPWRGEEGREEGKEAECRGKCQPALGGSDTGDDRKFWWDLVTSCQIQESQG